MHLYDTYVLPWLIDVAMRAKATTAERAKRVPQAAGVVVEIGVGSGLNFAVYGPHVARVIGIDPSPRLLAMARARAGNAPCPVELMESAAEVVPLPDASADTVLTTWTLCSIAHPELALHEMKRLLKPGGRLVFIEHGRAPDAGVRAWQDRLTPWWRRIAGGCELNRNIPALLTGAGFRVRELDQSYSDEGPRPFSYLYRGVAAVDAP
jgi:ubiquinone/menaquinone biosynthesis C-methylase UbiE